MSHSEWWLAQSGIPDFLLFSLIALPKASLTPYTHNQTVSWGGIQTKTGQNYYLDSYVWENVVWYYKTTLTFLKGRFCNFLVINITVPARINNLLSLKISSLFKVLLPIWDGLKKKNYLQVTQSLQFLSSPQCKMRLPCLHGCGEEILRRGHCLLVLSGIIRKFLQCLHIAYLCGVCS